MPNPNAYQNLQNVPTTMQYHRCSYHQCQTMARLSIFRFPTNDKDRLQLWIKNSGNKALTSLPECKLESMVLCDKHFCPKCINRSVKSETLSDHAIPIPYNKESKLLDDGHWSTCSCIRVVKVVASPKVYGNRKRASREIPDRSAVPYGKPTSCYQIPLDINQIKQECSDTQHDYNNESPPETDAVQPVTVKKESPVKLEIDALEVEETACNNFSDTSTHYTSMNSNAYIAPATDNYEELIVKKESAVKEELVVEEELIDKEESVVKDELEVKEESVVEEELIDKEESVVKDELVDKEESVVEEELIDKEEAVLKEELIDIEESVVKEIFVNEEPENQFKDDLVEITRNQDVEMKSSSTIGLADLHTSRNLHTRETKFICEKCSEGFFTMKTLIAHVRKQGDNIFSCNLCDKGFYSICNLTIHMRRHDGARPFTCDKCNKAFKRKSHMLEHEKRIHSREKPFTCNICNKGFFAKYQVSRHMLTHITTRKYSCETCNTEFRTGLCLQQHYKRYDFVVTRKNSGLTVTRGCAKLKQVD